MNKYRSSKTIIDGITFDSLLESRRYSFLKLMQKAGAISELKLQIPYTIIDKFTDRFGEKYRETKYIADFVYLNKYGNWIVEDSKSLFMRKNPLYRIKKKLLLSLFPGMAFFEIENPGDTRGIELK